MKKGGKSASAGKTKPKLVSLFGSHSPLSLSLFSLPGDLFFYRLTDCTCPSSYNGTREMELEYENIDWGDIVEAELNGDQETLRELRLVV